MPHNSFAELRPADSQGMETRNQVGQSLRSDLARLQRLLANEVFADAGDAHLVRLGYFRVLKSGCRGLRGTGRAFSAPPPGAPVRPPRRPGFRSRTLRLPALFAESCGDAEQETPSSWSPAGISSASGIRRK